MFLLDENAPFRLLQFIFTHHVRLIRLRIPIFLANTHTTVRHRYQSQLAIRRTDTK